MKWEIEKKSPIFFGKFQKIYYLCNVKKNKEYVTER